MTGVDISPKTIEYLARAVETHPRRGDLTLVEDDATSLARVGATDFDAVVGAHILHHVPEFERALVAARGRLRPGGRAVFLEPNPWNPLWYEQVTFHPGKSWRIERGLLDVWPGRVRRAFESAGFRPVGVTTFGCFPPVVLNWIPGADHAERVLEHSSGLRRFFTLNLFRGDLDDPRGRAALVCGAAAFLLIAAFSGYVVLNHDYEAEYLALVTSWSGDSSASTRTK